MKRSTLTVVVLACLVVVLLVITAFTAVSTANAQLGNTGVPVTCSGFTEAGKTSALTCSAADGMAFPNGTEVPSGHYLFVTDVHFNPMGSSMTGFWQFTVEQAQGAGVVSSVVFNTQTRTTFSEHFNTPLLVLSQGQHVNVGSSLASSDSVTTYVFGILTTNVNYLPLITR